MSWFQLDANSVADRVQSSARPCDVPSLGTTLLRATVGFTVLSVLGFAPWALAGRWFHRQIGEAGLYCVCAMTYIGMSAPLLHRLIIGPGSMSRFYKLFSATFAAYSVLWILGWMTLRGHPGSVVGLLAGAVAMGLMMVWAFDVQAAAMRVVLALFLLNAIGYFVGGWIEGAFLGAKSIVLFGTTMTKPVQGMVGKSLWGVCYGLGFGAGLGVAFHLCQAPVRKLIACRSANTNSPVNSR